MLRCQLSGIFSNSAVRTPDLASKSSSVILNIEPCQMHFVHTDYYRFII
jgi:hypothetical protein